MGIMGVDSSNRNAITFKNADGSVAGTMSISKPGAKKRKRLQYNFKQISSQIMRAKTSGSARRVMTMARSNTAMLRKKLKSGEYDEKELQNAIIHAEQMARIAKKRMKHLQEEESAKKQGGVCQAELDEEKEEFDWTDADIQQDMEISSEKMKELMQELQDSLEELENTDVWEELSGAVPKEMDPADLELLKKKHRLDELREIIEADMKYLKSFFDKLQKEKQEVSSGVSVELAGMEMPAPIVEAPAAVEGGSLDVSV